MRPAAIEIPSRPMIAVIGRVDELQLRQLLHSRGMRCTDSRLRVLRILASADAHLSAPQIHQAITTSGANSRRMDLVTVYRTVDALRRLGLVHAIIRPDQPASFGLTDRPHHHAICTGCGAVSEIDAALLGDVVEAAARASRHRLDAAASLEIHGLCLDCQTVGRPTETRADVLESETIFQED